MSKSRHDSQYDTYTGWKNRGRQVLKGEHSIPNHLGERVFHENQTAEIVNHRPRRKWVSNVDPWDFMDDMCYDRFN